MAEKKMISGMQRQIERITESEIAYTKDELLQFNNTLKSIYENINSYRSILPPPVIPCEEYALSDCVEKVGLWLDYAKCNCVSELSLFGANRQNSLDKKFIHIISLLRDKSPDELYGLMLCGFNDFPLPIQQWYCWYYNTYRTYWGNLEPNNNDYEVMEMRAKSFHDHWEDFLWLYNKLKDYRSKQVLYKVLLNWMFLLDMGNHADRFMDCYFDYDIIKCGRDEVFVDLGTYLGDTVSEFINNYGEYYRRIYCYDISSENLEKAKHNLSKYQNIEYRLKAVSDRKETLKFDSSLGTSANHVSESGSQEISAVTLDRDIDEKITFIKADVEGSELKAILGSRQHLINDKPKLAFSIYHNNRDVWEIARTIDSICPGYDFYMRHHGNLCAASEFTLLAVYNHSLADSMKI